MADVESCHDLANSPLNVLAVDADEDSLLSLEKVLEDCNHKVTKCKEAEQCLTILGDRKTKFHLVIIDVNLPTIDGYELCALIRKENDIPIILMSSTYTNVVETVQKALSHGACDFLLKPVTVENLRKIDLHMLQNRTLEKDVGVRKEWSCGEEEQVQSDPTNDVQDVNTRLSIEKRKGDSIIGVDPGSGKKQRVIWTQKLHKKFVEAVDSYGLEKAVPKKILEMMNIPELTRENVASHLQILKREDLSPRSCITLEKLAGKLAESSSFFSSVSKMCKFFLQEQNVEVPPIPQKDVRGFTTKQEKQQRRQQHKKHEQHQCKTNVAMPHNEPKPHDFKFEAQVLEDPTTQQPALMQVPSYHPHHTIHDTTYEALVGLRTNPSYETTMMGLKMDPTTGYVYSSNEFCQQWIHDQSLSQLSNETSGYLHDPSEMSQYHTNFASNPLLPKIEPSYHPSHNQIEDNYNFGNSIHNANIMEQPTFIQISHPQTMLNSVGYDVVAMHVDDLHQGGSVASQTDQEDNAETQDLHLKEFSMAGYQHLNINCNGLK